MKGSGNVPQVLWFMQKERKHQQPWQQLITHQTEKKTTYLCPAPLTRLNTLSRTLIAAFD